MRPTVSVVMPAYNAAATLAEAVRSVLEQSLAPDEIIVIDDGSTDETASVLAQFGPLIVTRQQPNSGLACARLAGVAMARGEFIALFDADDICEPERLEIQVAYLQANPEVLLVSSDFSAFDEHGHIVRDYSSTYYSAIARRAGRALSLYPVEETLELQVAGMPPRVVRTGRGTLYEKIIQGNFVHPPTVMFRRSVLAQAGNFDPDAGSMCDWDWIMRVARIGQIGFIADDLIRYRVSATQMSSQQYGYGRALANMQVLHRLRKRDPQAWARYRRHFSVKLGQNSLDAADALCEKNRAAGIGWLLKSLIRFRYVSKQSVTVLLKLTLPSRALQTLRSLRRS